MDISNEGKVIKEIENGKVALNGNELIPTDSNFFKERKKCYIMELSALIF